MNEFPENDRQKIERAIAAQEQLRGLVPDEIVDGAVTALRRQLELSGSESQRRRQVTVLFADVSGFTSMSSQLDAEAVAGVMNELWLRLDAIVTDHGGHVDKHIGDAVMAVWGVTSTNEDDPERAVRAGLAMQKEVQSRTTLESLSMRVGINTGPAHLGAVGASSEFTAIGDTVNVASRVQSFAPLGGVLITHDTYRHVRGVFDVEELEATTLKGKEAPIRVYVVRQAKAHSFRMGTRGVEGVETRMIGRTEELGALCAEFQIVVERPTTRVVTIFGDAGVGKSRLLYELENWIDLHPAPAYFFKGRALATHRSVAFGLVRNLVADRFDVLDSDSAAVVATKIRTGLSPTLTESEADLVGHWLGFDFGSSRAVQQLLGSGQLATTARAHLLRYLEVLAHDGPVVVFLEDLHWADDESLLLVTNLLDQLTDVHLLVVGATRSTLLERPGAGDLVARSPVVLQLEPLGSDATRTLVAEILQNVEVVPAALTDLIIERADGNAFYVEELVKMLIEDGTIETGEPWDPWRVHVEKLDAGRVPATLTGVLQTRLDGLAPAERAVLQRSSVVGRLFWDGTVAALGDDGLEATARSLDTARRRELVFRREHSSFDDTVEFAFKHALLRDVTYETVLFRDRQRLHTLVADWLRQHAGERLTEYAALIATHHRLGGDLAAAADLLHRSAVASLEAGSSGAARRSLDEAFALWRDVEIAPSLDALTTMAEACLRLGDIIAADRYDEEALRAPATPPERSHALFLGSWIAAEQGDHVREQLLLDEVLPEAERQGGQLLARVLGGLTWNAVTRGEIDDASAFASHATEIANQLDSPVVTREVLALQSTIAVAKGDMPGALRYANEALTLAIDAGDLEGQALAENNLGVCHHLLADANGERDEYLAALGHYRASQALNRTLGRKLQDGLALANVGQVLVRLGEDADARRCIHEALLAVRASGGSQTLLFCVLAEADRRLTNGDTASALQLMGFVQSHPSLIKDYETEIERILSRSGLTTASIEQGMTPGRDQDLDAVVDRLMAELADSDI